MENKNEENRQMPDAGTNDLPAVQNDETEAVENDFEEEIAAPPRLHVSEFLTEKLLKMSKWANLLAVAAVASNLLGVVNDYFIGPNFGDSFSLPLSELTGKASSIVGLVGVAAILVAQWFNYQFSVKIKSALENNDGYQLTEAFRNQRDYFMWTVIGVGITLFGWISAILSIYSRQLGLPF